MGHVIPSYTSKCIQWVICTHFHFFPFREECSSKGGVNIGSCASGFGVCCTFTLGCGDTSSENCTHFKSATTVTTGSCRAKICKLNDDICQIRLDFSSFVITGPATITTSIGLIVGGELEIQYETAKGIEVAAKTQCLTDLFTVSNQDSLPHICGTMTGEHVYFDASPQCNSLDFSFANAAVLVGTVASRAWNIKVTQYSCDYINLAPSGCDQWFFGSEGTNDSQG